MARNLVRAVLVATLFFSSATAFAQQEQNDYGAQSVSVVRQWVTFELRGGPLTPAGWRRAGNQFFDKPEPFSPTEEIRVVSDKFSLRLDTLTKGPAATVEADFPVCEGRIDSQLRFHPTDEGAPPGTDVLAGCWEIYKLVFDGQHWEVGAGGKVTPFAGTVNVEGMRIDGFPRYLVLDRAAAIRYVTAGRNGTSDPAIKNNASETLAALAKLRY